MEDTYRKSMRRSLDLEQLQDIKVPVVLVLGSAKLPLQELMDLKKEQIIELDRVAGEAVDVRINGRNVAKGEVVVVNNHFAVRLISLLSPEERLKLL